MLVGVKNTSHCDYVVGMRHTSSGECVINYYREFVHCQLAYITCFELFSPFPSKRFHIYLSIRDGGEKL